MDYYPFTRRHLKGLPANPWDKLNAQWRQTLVGGEWRGSLQEVLDAAASALENPSQRTREQWAARRWTDPESLLLGWIKARHLEVRLFPSEDLLVLRPKAREEKPLQMDGSGQP